MGEAEYDLVMPFVLTEDNGGPYEPHAFVSGYRLGELSATLRIAACMPLLGPPPLFTAPPNEEHQIDLIAMDNGFRITVEPFDDDWSTYSFYPVNQTPEF